MSPCARRKPSRCVISTRLAEATKLRGDGDVEVRWVAIPQTWRPLNDQFFDEATMRQLSDEGRRLGADPKSWNTTAP